MTYWKFRVPNFEEIEEFCKVYVIDNTQCPWYYDKLSDFAPLDRELTQKLYVPSMTLLAKEVGHTFTYKISNSWLNVYKRGHFQEPHDHELTLASVIFLNDGPNFGQFQFEDGESITPHVGDVIFFPADRRHLVTIHRSDDLRKTLSCNMMVSPFQQPPK